MKTYRTILAMLFLCLASSLTAFGQAERWIGMSEPQQNIFLSKRMESGSITGTFASYSSLLFAFDIMITHSADRGINETVLHSAFPPFYRATFREVLNSIAYQTGSSWRYDAKTGYFVFARPGFTRPYTIELAPKWTSKDMGQYMGYAPAHFPVGMDIYYYGTYSDDDPKKQDALWEKIRDAWAMRFAQPFDKNSSIAKMKRVTVDGTEALYLSAPSPVRPEVVWQQWVFVKNGHAFLIVSTLRKDDQATLAEVDAMVRSFHVTP